LVCDNESWKDKSSAKSSSSRQNTSSSTEEDHEYVKTDWDYLDHYVDGGTLTDSRDNKKYPTVIINGKRWMAANLRYTPEANASGIACFKGVEENCKTMGPMYSYSVKGVPKITRDDSWDEEDIFEHSVFPPSDNICPEGWRLPTEAEFASLKDKLPASATFDDFFSTASRRPFYAIYETARSSADPALKTDVEDFFYPTDAYGLNISRLTRRYYDQQCIEESGEMFAFASYWTSDSKDIPLWPDENGNVEVKPLRFYRFGGTDYCEAMLCPENYHFVRCIQADDPPSFENTPSGFTDSVNE
jgi:uncharacterized protein (TIGR02145 family)